jgi:glycosyltransferase involved in cell wall biosynthesis
MSKKFVEQFNVRGPIFTAMNAIEPVKESLDENLSPIGSDKMRLLFVGRLSTEKNLEFALNALSCSNLHYRLIIAGTGPLETELRNLYESDDVCFLGETSPDDLAILYSSNDILILPSVSEPWGLVVNEALSYGMPALVSDKVGCGPDLLTSAGEIFSVNNERDFITKLEKLNSELETFQQEARNTASRITVEAQAEQFWQVICR